MGSKVIYMDGVVEVRELTVGHRVRVIDESAHPTEIRSALYSGTQALIRKIAPEVRPIMHGASGIDALGANGELRG